MNKNKKLLILGISSAIFIGIIIFNIAVNKTNPNNNSEEITQGEANDNELQNESTKEENNTNIDESNSDTNDTSENIPVSNEEQQELDNETISNLTTGSTFSEFEKSLVENLGYTYFDEGCYDYLVDNKSLAFIEIFSDNIRISLDDKSNINNDNIKSAIKLLLPKEHEELFNYINNNSDSILMSLDNRSVSLNFEESKVVITICENIAS